MGEPISEARLIDKVSQLTTEHRVSINSETQIYHDLKITGDDFDDLLAWAESELNIKCKGHGIENGVPDEAGEWVDSLRKLLTGRSRFPSLTIRQFLEIIKKAAYHQK